MELLTRTLFVHTAGTRLTLDGRSIRALRDDCEPRRVPLEVIDAIVVLGGVDVSTPLLLACAEDGRVVAFLSKYGRPRCIVDGTAEGRSELRRLQYAAHADEERRSQLAGAVVAGKLDQMAWALRQWGRDATADRELLRQRAATLDEVAGRIRVGAERREVLLGLEGESSRNYFGGMTIVVRGGVWHGRRRRPPTDPLNATLSWLYGMTRIAVQGAVLVAGLDPGTGFLHGDRAGQPSLVLDHMEEFRPVADRLAVKLWNTRRLQERHFERGLAGAVALTHDGREVVFEAWHQHRLQKVEVKGRADAVPEGFLPIMQAHALANALRRSTVYEPHTRRVR